MRTGRIHALDPLAQISEAVAIGLLSEAEATQLRRYDALVMSIVNVDDFAPGEIGTAPPCT